MVRHYIIRFVRFSRYWSWCHTTEKMILQSLGDAKKELHFCNGACNLFTLSPWWHQLLFPGSRGFTNLRARVSRHLGNHFSQAAHLCATHRPSALVCSFHRPQLSGTAAQRSLVFSTGPSRGSDRMHPHSRYRITSLRFTNFFFFISASTDLLCFMLFLLRFFLAAHKSTL